MSLDKRITILFLDEETDQEEQFSPIDADAFVEYLFTTNETLAQSLFSDSMDSDENVCCEHKDLTQFLVHQVLIYIKHVLKQDKGNISCKAKYLTLKDFLTTAQITGFELTISMSDEAFDAASSLD